MLNDFLSGKGLMLLSLRVEKVDGAEGEGARKLKARGKKSKRSEKKIRENERGYW